MRLAKFGFRFEIYDSEHEKFGFMNSRNMNARQFWFLTKKKTINIIIPMPSLFYQTWNKEKGWTEDHPTKYYKVFIKIGQIKQKLKGFR